MNDIPTLKIGNLEINPPIIQGGMGVRISKANLAAAVAKTGCGGVIATAGLGDFEELSGAEARRVCEEMLRDEIRRAKQMTDGPIGVNIMVALTDFDDLVKVSVEENVDMIISGAGLPLDLPKFLDGKDIKLIPIVSSGRTFKLLCRRWKKQFDKIPDAVVVEGPMAGGHLGYTHESIVNETADKLEDIVKDVLEIANSYDNPIPVIAAGGIFDGSDIAHFLKLGASGVQMATRFVCTDECDADINFKESYINAKAEDITIIESPVGLPGRVIKNDFVTKVKDGQAIPIKCSYKCLRTCNPKAAPYCIAKVLANAADGKMDDAFSFAGSNAWRCTEIVPVQVLVDTLVEELKTALEADK